MRPRALFPRLEKVEDRVLTTAGVSSAGFHGLHPAIVHVQPVMTNYWASINLQNSTSRSITYKIVMTARGTPPFIRQETLVPGERVPWRDSFPAGGTLPNFSVSLVRVGGMPVRSGTKSLYPAVTTFEPSGPFILQNSYTYAFQTNPNGTISLYPIPT